MGGGTDGDKLTIQPRRESDPQNVNGELRPNQPARIERDQMETGSEKVVKSHSARSTTSCNLSPLSRSRMCPSICFSRKSFLEIAKQARERERERTTREWVDGAK